MGSDMTSSHTLPAAAVTDADDVADLHAAHYAKSAGAGRRITDDDQLHEARHPAPTTDRLALPPLRLGPLTIDVPVVLAPMAGIMRRSFGVCFSEWSPSDGSVVSRDHGCGAHSELDIPEPEPEQVTDPILDETVLTEL